MKLKLNYLPWTKVFRGDNIAIKMIYTLYRQKIWLRFYRLRLK